MAMYKYTYYMYMSSSTCRYCQGMYTYYTSIYCIVGNMGGFSDPINISHVTGLVCMSVHYSHIRMWLLNCGERKRSYLSLFEGRYGMSYRSGGLWSGLEWRQQVHTISHFY